MEVFDWKEFLYPYEQAVNELTVKFESLLNEYHTLGLYAPFESVAGRVKSVSSILDKALRKNIELDRLGTGMEDIAGIRILCTFQEDIYKVRTLIQQRNNIDMTVLAERDYIENPKDSGYRSYHMIVRYPVNTVMGYREVRAEIQIRTLAMNFWAAAEHTLQYKYKGKIPHDLQRRLRLLAEAAYRLDDEMGSIRGEIMYARHLNSLKNDLVAAIAGNLRNVRGNFSQEELERLQRDFLKSLAEGDMLGLKALNDKLEEGSREELEL